MNTNGQLVYWFPVSEKLVGSAPDECGGLVTALWLPGSWQCGLTEVGGDDRALAMAVTCSYRVIAWRH